MQHASRAWLPTAQPIQLTPYGHAFVRYDFQGQWRALRHLMLRTEPMRSVVQALIDHDGQSLDAIGGFGGGSC